MFCAISGEVPQEAVISKLSGHVYEKKLILKYIQDEGKCPVTGSPLTEQDLIALQVNKVVRPRPISTTSIPGLLVALQNEWDEVMLETFTLKQHLDTTRQELSQALYQHDAACRVIARLMKERDEARAALVNINSSTVSISNPVTNGHSHPEKTTSSSTQSMDVEVNSTPDINSGIDAVIIEKINDKCKELSSYRRTRKPLPEGILSKQSISSLKQISIFTPHKTDKVGVTALAISSSLEDSNGHFLLSGGADKAAILTDRISGTVVSRLTGHSKKVTGVAFHPTLGGRGPLFTSSADKTVKIWTSSEDKDKFTEASSTEHHTSDVTGIAVHPTGDYIVSTSLDGSWAFLDVTRGGKCLKKVVDEDAMSQYLSCQFHPDGLILATTIGISQPKSDNSIKIWDVREQKNVAVFAEHSDMVKSINFSENGYYLASACDDGIVRLWDLRKLKCVKTLELGGPIDSVAFDYSGLYLSMTGSGGEFGESPNDHGAVIYSVKEWASVMTLPKIHTKNITSLVWSRDSTILCSGSVDRAIRVFSTQ